MDFAPATHPLRQTLNDEVHARRAVPVATPARLSALTFWFGQDDSQQFAALQRLCHALGLPPPQPGAVQHHAISSNGLEIAWSLHTEFVRYRFTCSGLEGDPFTDTAVAGLPPGWLRSVPGQVLVAQHAVLLPEEDAAPLDELGERWLRREDIIGADIADGAATVVTDLRLHHDVATDIPFTRLVIVNRNMKPQTSGRMMTRLFEIEIYRILALLAFPIARRQMRDLDRLDTQMRQLTRRLSSEQDDDHALLRELSELAAELEDSVAACQYRFSAARAYYQLIERRISELRERRIAGLQPYFEFMEQRLAPAIDTCHSTEQRQNSLAERLQRTLALIRTRVEVAQDSRTQLLLASMNRRAQLQLRLQQTVEGLSVGVLTYYAVSLLAYASKALKALGLPLNPDLVAGLAVAPLGLGMWWGMRRMRRRLERAPRAAD
ncbi:DUF3422 family protein [Paludibacterium yongneupense]|uniref:DUF3422 family protein n=1 Tax=Paludibacterium yongneupense TaxID=400061 RepID=UPI000425074B|nr:DUF3422 domain-containing protein [Paludibacterium yongneupense]